MKSFIYRVRMFRYARKCSKRFVQFKNNTFFFFQFFWSQFFVTPDSRSKIQLRQSRLLFIPIKSSHVLFWFLFSFFNHRRVWFFKGTVCFRFVSGWWMQMELFLAIVFFLNRNFLSSLHHLLNLSFRTINGLDYVRKLIEEYQIYHSINREGI